jgi:hypothetical protein
MARYAAWAISDTGISGFEFPEYVDGTAQQAKNTVRRISLPEEDLPLGEVRASHCGPLNRQQLADLTRAN